MATLLLRLAGPLQSWGTRSRFSDRDTERFPSKSGVVGLLCAALGRPRSEPVDDLARLRMAARADLPGRLETDYHVTQDVPTADGSGRRTLPSYRHYLADAVFLIGLEGDDTLLAEVDQHLCRPVWPLFLGRKACPPSPPVWIPGGLCDEPLETAVEQWSWLGDEGLPGRVLSRWAEAPETLDLEWETSLDDSSGRPRQDVPVGPPDDRRFALRRVRLCAVPTPRREAT